MTNLNMGEVSGTPRILLRVEGAFMLAAAVSAFAISGYSWWLFAALFLLPDLSMLGYLINPRIGAVTYNTAHSYIFPVGLLIFGLMSDAGLAVSIGLIWTAHIGFDRMLGFGLKYADAFKHTHLGFPTQKSTSFGR